MSTSVAVEQHLPVSIQLLSRISAYAHVFESILAIVLFWLFPSLRPTMPERQITFRRRRRSYTPSIHSVKSTVSTLVDEGMIDKDNELNLGEDDDMKSYKFPVLSTPMMKSKSLSLMPFARRMSLPAKRFSEHLVTTVSSPFQTPHPSPFQSPYPSPINSPLQSPVQTPSSEFEPTCYFSPLGHRSEYIYSEDRCEEQETQVVVDRAEEVEYLEEEFLSNPVANLKNIEKVTRIKRVTRKAKTLLRLRRQS